MDSKLLLTLVIAVLLASCSIDSKSCTTDTDCFAGESCINTACVQTTKKNNQSTSSNNQTTECGENSDCTSGFCKKPEGVCECPVGEHKCGNNCVSDLDPTFCGGCEPCPTDPRGQNTCNDANECSIQCSPPFQPCLDEDCPRACVGCTSDENCGADAPNCVNRECQSCESDSECGRFSTKVCNSGKCVECTESEPTACMGNSCDPKISECTETKLRSRNTCEVCVSDFDCEFGFGCVAMKFNGADLDGGFCLPKFNNDPCDFPLPVRTSKKSLSTGQSEQYCGISENLLTCKSYTDFGKLCERHSDCGLKDFNDGLCRPVFGIERCTFSCTSSDDCPGGSTCQADYCLQN